MENTRQEELEDKIKAMSFNQLEEYVNAKDFSTWGVAHEYDITEDSVIDLIQQRYAVADSNMEIEEFGVSDGLWDILDNYARDQIRDDLHELLHNTDTPFEYMDAEEIVKLKYFADRSFVNSEFLETILENKGEI